MWRDIYDVIDRILRADPTVNDEFDDIDDETRQEVGFGDDFQLSDGIVMRLICFEEAAGRSRPHFASARFTTGKVEDEYRLMPGGVIERRHRHNAKRWPHWREIDAHQTINLLGWLEDAEAELLHSGRISP
ncbi:MAG TPA: hypothetical protein VLF41_02805 [Candidatus Nanoarchaeia archaeon]|nr:hypothetical protein [Candidatus Nanoarchaeia archaeon]